MLANLTTTTLAMRDVLIVLLAYQAQQTGDPDEVFRRISNALNQKISSSEGVPEIGSQPELIEGLRMQIDSIVGAARALFPMRSQ
jgi:hypothetical protein